MKPSIVVSFPREDRERERLRRMAPGVPLPAIVPHSIDTLCDGCSMVLAVGPRAYAVRVQLNIPLFCPWCAVRVGALTIESKVEHLGNPDSHPEKVH